MSAAALNHWLRMLWGKSPPLHFDCDTPYIAERAFHLPPSDDWRQQRAAAAHAAAHLVYSPYRFDGTGLAPIARTLMALLEDARVETLASRELPGLTRLWRPLHTATPADGTTFEALMRRLARALADPRYVDPHPWVSKGRRLFYLDETLRLPALRTPAELRQAALRLGNDIGQMRLQFNAKTYRPEPPFRDDHRWMWGADDLAEVEPPPVAPMSDVQAPDDDDDEAFSGEGDVTHHPEWDRLIGRLRPDWSSVFEQPMQDGLTRSSSKAQRDDSTAHHVDQQRARLLLKPLRGITRRGVARHRKHDGETFDLEALVDWRLARRISSAADGRVYRSHRLQHVRASVWLLVDQSASTAAPYKGGAASILQAASRSAAAAALALRSMGIDCVVAGFSSNGRHEVRMRTFKAGLKDTSEAMGDSLAARLKLLRSGGSTRLGAAIRHAATQLARSRAPSRWVLILSDGEPHDVDVHDPRYLIEDARHAVSEAARMSVRVACLALINDADPKVAANVRRIFGSRSTRNVTNLEQLPQAMQQLLS